MAPFLGAWADISQKRKPLLALFTAITIVATALLSLAKPSPHWVEWSLFFYGLGLFGFELALLYYNAMLKGLVAKPFIGRLSNWGWAAGYFGGIAALLIGLFIFIKPNFISHVEALNIRLVTLFIAIWMSAFCWPLFYFIKEEAVPASRQISLRQLGINFLQDTLKLTKQYKPLFRFILARLFYTDALNTVFIFSGIYAATYYHFALSEILLFGLIANVVAGIGCLIFGFIDDYLGPKFVLTLSLSSFLLSLIILFLTTSAFFFWLFGLVIATLSGPLQASSRSYLTQLTPEIHINKLFGFYTLTGRMTAFIGPLLTSLCISLFGNLKLVIIVIFILAAIGALLLVKLPEISQNHKALK